MGAAQCDACLSRATRLQRSAARGSGYRARACPYRPRPRVRPRRAVETCRPYFSPRVRGRRGGGSRGRRCRPRWEVRVVRVRVFVTLKPSVFDPQGKTVTDALHTLGYSSVTNVRQGKYFELDIDAERPEDARNLAA